MTTISITKVTTAARIFNLFSIIGNLGVANDMRGLVGEPLPVCSPIC